MEDLTNKLGSFGTIIVDHNTRSGLIFAYKMNMVFQNEILLVSGFLWQMIFLKGSLV